METRFNSYSILAFGPMSECVTVDSVRESIVIVIGFGPLFQYEKECYHRQQNMLINLVVRTFYLFCVYIVFKYHIESEKFRKKVSIYELFTRSRDAQYWR